MLPFLDKDDWNAMNRNAESIPIIVTPIAGEPLRFHVNSRTVVDLRYLVDLEEYGFNGFCGCADFDFRKRPLAQGGSKARCWHIRQAREFFVDEMLKRITENFYEQKQS